MQKEHEAPMKKKYEKPEVTVTKLEIEERLMACRKQRHQRRCGQIGRVS
jgi:hypothetical protein